MIRYRQRIQGFRFHEDCPDFVKARLFAAIPASVEMGERPPLAHCYKDWVGIRI